MWIQAWHYQYKGKQEAFTEEKHVVCSQYTSAGTCTNCALFTVCVSDVSVPIGGTSIHCKLLLHNHYKVKHKH